MKTKFINQIEPWIGKEEIQEVTRVLESGWITEANKTREFERLIGEYVGSKHVSIVTNGTVSLTIALLALGIKKGDEVIVPDFTMVATPNAVVLAGAKPILVDIKKETLCIDEKEIESKITSRTKCIITVALNGRSPDFDYIQKIATKHKLFIIEDAAQALGSFYKGKHIGTWGDIGSFSFSTPKVITTGQGGAVVTDRKDLYEKIIRLKDFGRLDRNTQDHDELGYNFKFTDVLAAIGVAQIKKLSWRVNRKKKMFQKYFDLLSDVSEIEFVHTNLKEVSPWYIDIIVSDPIKLQKFLKKKGIGTRLFYPSIHTTKPYIGSGLFPNSAWVSKHGLWLPSSSFLTDSNIMTVCNHIRNFYKLPRRKHI